ncbi:glycosyltransferase [Pseudoxanthomonas jiangsuensis]|uniref:glycosyltransferase n=1 Tax=Pseudoxanthomonas jiangsuensis TaxID=619688 RepID=UPI001391A794|nr:glycosyltransferase [Pseudoxanthomonas jiangsuensis]
MYLTPESLRDPSNPWMAVPSRIEPEWRPGTADLLFLAGMDWQALPRVLDGRSRVLNLVQGLRHADPVQPLHAFLDRPATRICVSGAVATAITATGRVNGSVRIIPAALDLGAVMAAATGAHGDAVFIGAAKTPRLGNELAQRLRARGHAVELATDWLPRGEYLAAIAAAAVAVPLPAAAEGFFLPGLEVMALGRPLVMPACGGNAEYARDGMNCLMPEAEADALVQAVERLLAGPGLAQELVVAGRATAARHDLPAEREAFASLIGEIIH